MDRVIIITGANNGIGLSMTQALLERGDLVAALDLSLENLPAHAHLLPAVCDVRDGAATEVFVREVVASWGRASS